jgi:hypothetical protein
MFAEAPTKYPDDEAPRSVANAAVFAARKSLLF